MGFIKKGVPPPAVEEEDILRARIISISKVTSKWKDEQGNPREQLQFDLELEGGYKFRSWIAYYQGPSDRSKLGKLAVNFMDLMKQQHNTVDQFLEALKNYGWIYVRCKGFREFEEEVYPNFGIVVTKIPPLQTKMPIAQSSSPVVASSTQNNLSPETLDFIRQNREIIEMGLPLNETDWNTTVPARIRVELLKGGLIDKRETLYFFTKAAESFF